MRLSSTRDAGDVTIALPHPDRSSALDVTTALAQRRSCRRFADAPIPLAQLSQLLWAAQGITGPDAERTAPSAGGQYPLDILVVAGAVSGLDVGLYRYLPGEHRIIPIDDADHRPALHVAAIDDQPWVREAAVILVVAADMARINAHFADQAPAGRRGSRYAHIETGAVSQNVHLQAEALGLGMVLVAGFDDATVSSDLDLPSGVEPTGLLAVGVRAPA